jgi:beta-lactamase regulating signal transducer with metallopeptidase domain
MIWLSLQTLAQISAERILNALPEGFLIAFFAWALLRVLRRQNAGTRFAIWFLALLTISLLPISVLPMLSGLGGGRVHGEELGQSLLTSGTSWVSLRPAITVPGHWGVFIFAAWALGASIGLLRLALGLWQLRKLRQSCTPIEIADLDPILQQTVASIGASRAVMVATSEQVRVPAALGFWTRMIVLPTWALQELPAEDLNVILLHESAHLRRWDEWTNLVQKIVRAIFFFHPAVWWIENRLSVEREMACDDAVLARTANPRGYAACLVSLLEKSLAHRLTNKQWSMVQAAVHRAHEASLRLAQILDTNRPKGTRVWKPALAMVATFSMVCLVASPHAPQFVAFDNARSTKNSSTEHAVSARQSSVEAGSLQAANVIPANFRIDEASSPAAPAAKVVRTPLRAHESVVHESAVNEAVNADVNENENLFAPFRAVAARMNADTDNLLQNASDDQQRIPQFQTLVFFQATQYQINDSPVWRVQVWRVTVLNASGERWIRVPAPRST